MGSCIGLATRDSASEFFTAIQAADGLEPVPDVLGHNSGWMTGYAEIILKVRVNDNAEAGHSVKTAQRVLLAALTPQSSEPPCGRVRLL